MLIDASKKSQTLPKNSDVVIVGAGTVGLFVARELASSGHSVIVLESGDRVTSNQFNAANAVSVGKQHDGTEVGRAQGLGGTSSLWGGQLVEFEQSDFSSSGKWPISYKDVAPWYGHVYNRLGVSAPPKVDQLRKAVGGEIASGSAIERFFTYWLPIPNFARLFQSDIEDSSLITVVINARASAIEFSGEQAVGIIVETSHGVKLSVNAPQFVFAAGTIEMNRLFLLLKADKRTPWANNENIGLYFQDHLGGIAAKVKLLDEAKFREYFENGMSKKLKYQPKLRLSPLYSGRMECRSSGFFSFKSDMDDNLANLKRTLKSLRSSLEFSTLATLPKDLLKIGWAFFPLIKRYLQDRRVFAFFDKSLDFYVQSEQWPISSSRIDLSDEISNLDGMRKAKVNWQLDGREVAAIRSFVLIADQYLQEAGIARLIINPSLEKGDPVFLDTMNDTFHQCGGLCMSGSQATGVVDKNCKVWGAANVFIAGASIFPTSSYANCTLTALALAARLADHIKVLK